MTSLRRLHSEARLNQMGFSIPAHAIRLGDPAAKPEPVLLYFGIIDFLQVSNLPSFPRYIDAASEAACPASVSVLCPPKVSPR